MNDLGILLVDMQYAFVGYSPSDEIRQLIESQKRLLDFASKQKIPVIVLEYTEEGKTMSELTPSLKSVKSYIIKKYTDNGFVTHDNQSIELESFKKRHQNEKLLRLLEKEKIKKLILTGINKDGCVYQTANGAVHRGYTIYTSEELMNRREVRVSWFNYNSNHYEKLDDLLLSIAQ